MKNLIALSSMMLILSSPAFAANKSLPACITQQFGMKTIQSNAVQLEAPEIAENGAVVGVEVKQINNVPAGHYVKQVQIFNEFRSEPVATFQLSSMVRPQNLKTRVRLPASTRLFAVAQLDNGDLLGGQRFVKVTIGGCGGGEVAGNDSGNFKRVCSK